jgi:putative transcriptional regulator
MMFFVNTFLTENEKFFIGDVAILTEDGYNGNQEVEYLRIECRLSHILGAKRLKMSDVARQTGIGKTTLLRLYHDRGEGIRFDVLAKLCRFLDCQPGDLLVYLPDDEFGR